MTLVHDCQIDYTLEPRTTDVCVDIICTPTKMIRVGKGVERELDPVTGNVVDKTKEKSVDGLPPFVPHLRPNGVQWRLLAQNK